jgi:hypothetical protein
MHDSSFPFSAGASTCGSRFSRKLEEAAAVNVVPENVFPPVAAAQEMIDSALRFLTLYIRLPFLWRILGTQFLLIARRA